jgi:hypothetical protein
MKELVASNTGDRIKVDDSSFNELSPFIWYAIIQNGKPVGVFRQHEGRKVLLSHAVLKIHEVFFEDEVDHKDRDALNNQFENLRPATKSQNAMNRGLRSDNSTGYKGVCMCKVGGKFQAQIVLRGRAIYLGRFCSSLDAAKAYDKAAIQYFGEFAVLNFPKEAV